MYIFNNLPNEIKPHILFFLATLHAESLSKLSSLRVVNRETKYIVDSLIFKELLKLDFGIEIHTEEEKPKQPPEVNTNQTPENTQTPDYFSLYKQAFFQEESQQVTSFTTVPSIQISFLEETDIKKQPAKRNWLLACRRELSQRYHIAEARSRFLRIAAALGTPGNQVNLDSLNDRTLSVEVKSILKDFLYIKAVKDNNKALLTRLLTEHPLNDINMTIYDYTPPASKIRSPLTKYLGATLLGHISRHGHLEMAKMVTERYFDKLDINAYSEMGYTALHDCVFGDREFSQDRKDLAQHLLSLRADPDALSRDPHRKEQITPYGATQWNKPISFFSINIIQNSTEYNANSVRDVITEAHNAAEQNTDDNYCVM